MARITKSSTGPVKSTLDSVVDKLHEMLREKVERETGKKGLAPRDYPKEDHDTWAWIQKSYNYGSSYPFTLENVKEFIEFCEESNGFRIC